MIQQTETGRWRLTTLDEYGKIRKTFESKEEAQDAAQFYKSARAAHRYYYGREPTDARCTHPGKKRCRRKATTRNPYTQKRTCEEHARTRPQKPRR